MCKINLLIIGNSFQQNKDIISTVKEESDALAGDSVQFVVKTIDPFYSSNIKPEEYDLAVIYEDVIGNICSKNILGSGIPILSWSVKPLSKHSDETLSSIVRSVVEKSLLCEHIIKITNEINVTHQFISNSPEVLASSVNFVSSDAISSNSDLS